MHRYSLSGHGQMVSDKGRVSAYSQALRKTVKPGCVVAEIGAGTALFSMLACQFGARRVYAIETTSIIEIGRKLAAANGFTDRIVFIEDMSTRVQLPESCDVVVSDLHGVLPWFEMHIPSIADARDRFLAPNGVLIPAREVFWAAVVEAPELHGSIVNAWLANPSGFDMKVAREFSTNQWRKAHVKPEQLLTEPKCAAELDYSTVTDPRLSVEIEWRLERPGTGSGIVTWFDSLLRDDVTFSNSPSDAELIYGQAFFPWPEQVRLSSSDRVRLDLKAHLVNGDYVWAWGTRVFQSGGDPKPTRHFRQSTFLGDPVSLKELHRGGSTFAPTLDQEGQIELFILGEMKGTHSNGELAEKLARRFPAKFEKNGSALNRVAECSRRYGK